MFSFRNLLLVTVTINAIGLSACTSNPNNESVRRLTAPEYARRSGAESYTVNCGGTSAVAINRGSMNSFYHQDGSMKSFEEFCKDYDPSKLIRN